MKTSRTRRIALAFTAVAAVSSACTKEQGATPAPQSHTASISRSEPMHTGTIDCGTPAHEKDNTQDLSQVAVPALRVAFEGDRVKVSYTKMDVTPANDTDLEAIVPDTTGPERVDAVELKEDQRIALVPNGRTESGYAIANSGSGVRVTLIGPEGHATSNAVAAYPTGVVALSHEVDSSAELTPEYGSALAAWTAPRKSASNNGAQVAFAQPSNGKVARGSVDDATTGLFCHVVSQGRS